MVEREEMLRELLGILKDVKAALTAPEADLAALLEEQLRRQKTRIDTGRRSAVSPRRRSALTAGSSPLWSGRKPWLDRPVDRSDGLCWQ